jgi:hypothetical protein
MLIVLPQTGLRLGLAVAPLHAFYQISRRNGLCGCHLREGVEESVGDCSDELALGALDTAGAKAGSVEGHYEQY